MMAVIQSAHQPQGEWARNQTMQVMINVQAEVLNPEIARRKANVWLLENVGNVLHAENPELVLGDHLYWRFEVFLSLVNLSQPGTGERRRLGQMMIDAVNGQVQSPAQLTEYLQTNAEVVNR